MKLERLSENQIRCTLYKSDLADKELHLTELAYGTDKAKELFRELMQQSSSGLGFEVDHHKSRRSRGTGYKILQIYTSIGCGCFL